MNDDDRRTEEGLARRRERRRSPEYLALQRVRQKAAIKAWKLAHPDKVKASRHAQYLKHREKILQRTKAWRAAHWELQRERSKRSRIRCAYGLELEQIEAMRVAQNNSCAICFRQLALVVDHNHSTGKVRALLCNCCNQMIGLAKESLTVLESAKNYLRKYEQPN